MDRPVSTRAIVKCANASVAAIPHGAPQDLGRVPTRRLCRGARLCAVRGQQRAPARDDPVAVPAEVGGRAARLRRHGLAVARSDRDGDATPRAAGRRCRQRQRSPLPTVCRAGCHRVREGHRCMRPRSVRGRRRARAAAADRPQREPFAHSRRLVRVLLQRETPRLPFSGVRRSLWAHRRFHRVPISFAPRKRAASSPKLNLDPAGPYTDGQQVTVTLSGWPGSIGQRPDLAIEHLTVGQCGSGADSRR